MHKHSDSIVLTLTLPDADSESKTCTLLVQRGDWLNGACPFPERHKHGDRHPSFGFNTKTGYGFCHVCGTLLLKNFIHRLL